MPGHRDLTGAEREALIARFAGSVEFPADDDRAQALGVIVERAAHVMSIDHVPVWLLTPVDALDGERPIDLIARGESTCVHQVLSGLEDPGAS